MSCTASSASSSQACHSRRLPENLEGERLEAEVVAGIEQHGAVRDGDDLWHQRAHDHVVAGLAFGSANLPHAAAVVGHRHEYVEAGIDVEAPAVHAIAADRGFEIGLAVRGAPADL